jgi:hypothetical protein
MLEDNQWIPKCRISYRNGVLQTADCIRQEPYTGTSRTSVALHYRLHGSQGRLSSRLKRQHENQETSSNEQRSAGIHRGSSLEVGKHGHDGLSTVSLDTYGQLTPGYSPP